MFAAGSREVSRSGCSSMTRLPGNQIQNTGARRHGQFLVAALLCLVAVPPAPAEWLGQDLGRLGSPRDSIGPVGYAVAIMPDVQGDGYGDVLVGAPSWTSGGGAVLGRAHLYRGGTVLDTLSDLTFQGQSDGDEFGFAVCGGTDLNADGAADAVVGAPAGDYGGQHSGRVYLYWGGTGMDAAADLTLDGPSAYLQLGYSLATGQSVNGDAYPDLVAGAPASVAWPAVPGYAYLFHGGPSMDNLPDLTLTGEAAGDLFGISVSSGRDVTGDGSPDVIVGASLNDGAGTNAGRAYVYRGGASMDAVPDFVLSGEAAQDRFGRSVALVEDISGDGWADVVVGAARYNNGTTADAGRVYVYFGGPSFDTIADITITGSEAGALLGTSVGGAGDATGDGQADLLVGAPGSDVAGVDAGRLYLYGGGSSLDAVPELIAWGAEPGWFLGAATSGGSDITSDGVPDMAIGAPFGGGVGNGWIVLLAGGSPGQIHLTARRNVSGIQLRWTHTAPADSYQVFSGSEAYFAADTAAYGNLVGTLPAHDRVLTSSTAVGVADSNYFYCVRGLNVSGQGVGWSNRAGEFDFDVSLSGKEPVEKSNSPIMLDGPDRLPAEVQATTNHE
jgi:hypothetical protein